MADSADILNLGCVQILAQVRDGHLRAEELLTRVFEQHQLLRTLNVSITMDEAHALTRAAQIDAARARGLRLPALAGLPILVKDNIDVAGLPTTSGSKALKDNYPAGDAAVVARLRGAGAIVVGKANMDELAYGATSTNFNYGAVRNPYDLRCSAGGSSGGSAAAVSARIVPAALGSDTTGSVRIPAAFCGVVGFRPTSQPAPLYSCDGLVPAVRSLDTIGTIARTVADVAVMHAAIVGQGSKRPSLKLHRVRIGVPRFEYWDDLDPEVARVSNRALARVAEAGATLVELDLRGFKAAAWTLLADLAESGLSDLQSYIDRIPTASIDRLMDETQNDYLRVTLQRLMATSGSRRATRQSPAQLIAAYRTLFRDSQLDVIVFPTQVLLPPPLVLTGEHPDDELEFNGRRVPKGPLLARNVFPAVTVGAPAISLPAGLSSNGMPVGLEFDGLPGGDETVLAVGILAEGAIGQLSPPDLAGVS